MKVLFIICILIKLMIVLGRNERYFFDGDNYERFYDRNVECLSQFEENGLCVPLHKCYRYHRREAFRNRCYRRAGPNTVCCVRGRPPGYTDDDEDVTTTLATPGTRISEQKFEEYIEQVFPEINDADAVIHNGRILTLPGEYPHMSAVGFSRDGTRRNIDWKCGGSLISENFVITAAHCTNINGDIPDFVRVGDLNLLIRETTVAPQSFRIAQIFVHPHYNSSNYYNDIALLRLSKFARFTKFVYPICIWTRNNIRTTDAIAMGYGTTEFGGVRRNELTEMFLSLLTNIECIDKLPHDTIVRDELIDSQICAIDTKGNSDTCQGDSGGPLQLNMETHHRLRYHLVGITSYGYYCGSQYPGIYTRVSSYIDWIEGIVWHQEYDY